MKKYIVSSKLSDKFQSDLVGKVISMPIDFREAFLNGAYFGSIKSGNIRLADFIQELNDIIIMNDSSSEIQNKAIRDWFESYVK